VDSQHKSTIQINGIRYNAFSGKSIKPIASNSIDGFVKPVRPKVNQDNDSGQKSPLPTNQHYFSTPRNVNNISHQPTKSTTLMRSAVTKPDKKYRPITKINAPIPANNNQPMIKKPPMVDQVDPKLERRAMTYRQNKMISRYNATVYPAQDYQNTNTVAQRPNSIIADQQTQVAAKKDIFQEAIDNATSHTQPKLTKKQLKAIHGKQPRKFKLISTLAVGLFIVAILSFAVYQNIPNIMAKVAASKAGFAVSIPNYKPSGFSLANVGYQPGTVQFNYKSNLSNNKYSVIEHSSTWDSATLVSSLLLPTSGNQYKEVTLNGMQVYLYGKDEASWVNHGVLYIIKGNGSLSTNQLIQLATNF